jgi:5-methylcytosine-specific restriction endonuclease McrA
MSKWRQANPELHRDRNKSYQQKNPIKSKLLRKQRHDRNRDADNAYSRNYYKKNPYRIRELASIRKRKVSIAGIFLVTDKELSRLYNSKCQICGSCELIEIDHIIPIARGGRHSIGNLMSLCRSCNRSKSDKLHIEFIFIRREFEKLATNMVN